MKKFEKYITSRFPDGQITATQRWNIICPKCRNEKKRCYIELATGATKCFHCDWTCHDWKGLVSSVEGLGNPNLSEHWIDSHEGLMYQFEYEIPVTGLTRRKLMDRRLPPFFKPVPEYDSYTITEVYTYLSGRGFDPATVIQKTKMGYCYGGKYKGRIIIPIYEDDKLVFFFDRDITGLSQLKTLGIGDSKESWPIPKSSVLFLSQAIHNTVQRLTVCEGIFSACSAPGDFTAALLGKACSGVQFAKLIALPVEEYVLCLDPGTEKETSWLAYELTKWGRKVSVIYLTEGDPNDYLVKGKALPEPRPWTAEDTIYASMKGYVKETNG